jgi:pyridoxamine 5'-phosphate oxidase
VLEFAAVPSHAVPSPIRRARPRPLLERRAGLDPFAVFERWYRAARRARLPEVDAMTLATATRRGVPSARMVLLKGAGQHGFDFYTHRASRKGRELAANPRAALVLFWQPLHRQVRIEGRVRPLSDAESDAYFATRARGSQLSASISPQSRVIESRQALERARARLATRLTGRDVLRPAAWGGYRVIPDAIEFWQGRDHRLHDRLRYRRVGRRWVRERLAP